MARTRDDIEDQIVAVFVGAAQGDRLVGVLVGAHDRLGLRLRSLLRRRKVRDEVGNVAIRAARIPGEARIAGNVLPFWSVQWSNTNVESAGTVTVPSLIDPLLEIPTDAVPVASGNGLGSVSAPAAQEVLSVEFPPPCAYSSRSSSRERNVLRNDTSPSVKDVVATPDCSPMAVTS